MPYIIVHMIKRDAKARRSLAKAITEAVVTTLGTKPEKVHVVINEMQKDQNATAGVLYSDKEKQTKKRKA